MYNVNSDPQVLVSLRFLQVYQSWQWGDLMGTVGASDISEGISSVTTQTEDDLMVLAACTAACAHIQLRNPLFFDVEVGAELSSLAIRPLVQPSSFLKRSLI